MRVKRVRMALQKGCGIETRAKHAAVAATCESVRAGGSVPVAQRHEAISHEVKRCPERIRGQQRRGVSVKRVAQRYRVVHPTLPELAPVEKGEDKRRTNRAEIEHDLHRGADVAQMCHARADVRLKELHPGTPPPQVTRRRQD